MKTPLTLIAIALTALCAFAACTKDSTTKDAPKKTNPITDSASVALTLTAGLWVLNKVEYPKTATTWANAYDSGTLGYVTLAFNADKTFATADNNTATNTGRWKLSTNGKLITRTVGTDAETDTIAAISPSALQLVMPKQINVGLNFYDSYMDTCAH